MNKFLNKIMIVDGSYMIIRALKNPSLSELMTSSGVLSGGVFGFMRMLAFEIRKHPGYYPIVCFDSGQSERRLKLYPNYKHHADKQLAPPIPGSDDDKFITEYRSQRGAVIELLRTLGIPSLRIRGWEGDDLCYVLTKVSEESILISDDKDYIQMTAPNVMVSRPMNNQLISYQDCDDHYKYPEFILAKAITGDPSDNIPQVAAGVGGTSASKIAALLKSYHKMTPDDKPDYSDLRRGLEEITPQIKKAAKILENYDKFEMNLQLMDLNLVEIPEDVSSIIESTIKPVLGKVDFFKAMEWLAKYEIKSIDTNQIISTLVPYANTVIKE